MRTYEIPDLLDSLPDDDEPVEAKQVECWNCGGWGRTGDDEGYFRCEACGGTGYTYETTDDEEAEDAG